MASPSECNDEFRYTCSVSAHVCFMLVYKRHAYSHARIDQNTSHVLLTTMSFCGVRTSTPAGAHTRWLHIHADCKLVFWLCMRAVVMRTCVCTGCWSIASCCHNGNIKRPHMSNSVCSASVCHESRILCPCVSLMP